MPLRFFSSGLGSNRSIWLGPPCWNKQITDFAFAFGAVSFGVFKRDAIAMKTVSVAALATIYLAAPLDLASLAVIAAGILLNGRAAAALGVDRTYYGHEVAGLPPAALRKWSGLRMPRPLKKISFNSKSKFCPV